MLDAKRDEAAVVLEALIDDADVLIENMRPGAMDRLGFDWVTPCLEP
jgi:crotonobetainyl-CoA:carnitine CoA-transferase CaiB-like acyl-CoA transferase